MFLMFLLFKQKLKRVRLMKSIDLTVRILCVRKIIYFCNVKTHVKSKPLYVDKNKCHVRIINCRYNLANSSIYAVKLCFWFHRCVRYVFCGIKTIIPNKV